MQSHIYTEGRKLAISLYRTNNFEIFLNKRMEVKAIHNRHD